MDKTPLNWKELEKKAKIAKKSRKKLALNYHYTQDLTPIEVWYKLLGIAKYLADKKNTVNQDILAERLGLSLTTLRLGLLLLTKVGLLSEIQENELTFEKCEPNNYKKFEQDLLDFLDLVGEEQFKKQYFTQVTLETLAQTITI
jgi:single-stranded-DNA-specific exonuclease